MSAFSDKIIRSFLCIGFRSNIFQVLHFPVIGKKLCLVIFWSCKFSAPCNGEIAPTSTREKYWAPRQCQGASKVHRSSITLRAKLSSAVYCNRCAAKPSLTWIGATSRPCGAKNLIFGLWVNLIPAVCRFAHFRPKLCMMIELVEAIKKVSSIFPIQHIVFPARCTEKFGLIDRRAVSQQITP